ncbi:hypothetical protein BJQ94_14490 [Cryobacterium sp. SO2]|uniref:hypothetical protein n=1 Tax=Cryobacterium sp. SO2 TaxID=1897060 RepID=UPI00223E1BEF|nr:hypothetical protein [Cryobacterium sp. SO2]WEO76562.1 hypothetical protein BJQ94_14490 [Cryobacterium sp. SO2]
MPDRSVAPDGAAVPDRSAAPDSAAGAGASAGAGEPRQSVVKSSGARRARLTPAPNTDTSPQPAAREEGGHTDGDGSSTSPNDARLRQDKPPHW